jgi:hypothetical protein
MTVYEDDEEPDEPPHSQAFQQSLFFLRQGCPEAQKAQLEQEINNNKDIQELQALVYQWATNATQPLHRKP